MPENIDGTIIIIIFIIITFFSDHCSRVLLIPSKLVDRNP